jgi:hypothetical protein
MFNIRPIEASAADHLETRGEVEIFKCVILESDFRKLSEL